MFGTIFRMRPKQGQEQTVEQLFQRWRQERQPHTTGFVNGYLLTSRSNPGKIIQLSQSSNSETSFRKNAEAPEQDRWYQELRATLQADPEWNDGDVTALTG